MSTNYAQSSTKRQKMTRVSDSGDYFQNIEKLEYFGPTGENYYRYYNSSERVHGRAVEDWLKLAVDIGSLRYDGSDHRRLDDTSSLENSKRTLKSCLDLTSKLGLRHWCGFDSDVIPENAPYDDAIEMVSDVVMRSGIKTLWLAPNLHSNARYSSGALTNHDASTYIRAAAQIKRCLDLSHRLNCECFPIHPIRDGYVTVKNDVNREMKLFAKLLKTTSDYKDRINFRGQLMIMPIYKKDRDVNRYMWDAGSCMYFLKHFGLERSFKVYAEPGHQMYMANVYNMLGGVQITNDCDPYDNKMWALLMRSIIKQGSPLPGGISLKIHPQRTTNTSTIQRTIASSIAQYVDALARGLRAACRVEQDQCINKYIQQKYASYHTGFGARAYNGELTLEEMEEIDKKNPQQESTALRSDTVDLTFQKHLDNGDL